MMKETAKWVKGKALVKSLSRFISNLTTSYCKMDGKADDGRMEGPCNPSERPLPLDGAWTQIGEK